MSAPAEHVLEAKKLEADGLVNLYEFRLRNNIAIFRFKDGLTATWQGVQWEACPVSITGESMTAEAQEIRPSCAIANPYGLFTPYILSGIIERCIVVRKKVLLQHVIDDVNIFQQRMWYINRVKEFVSGQVATFELRNMTEGPGFTIPVRSFSPPDFPTVRLS